MANTNLENLNDMENNKVKRLKNVMLKTVFIGSFLYIVSRDFEWLQIILMNRACAPDVPLKVFLITFL